MKQKKLPQLQGLRALAFLGVFLQHAGSPIVWGRLSVSIFFVLSGYLLMRSTEGRELSASPATSLRYALRKISRLYPLHLVTMLLAVLPAFLAGREAIRSQLLPLALNVTLMQSWYPNAIINVSLNGVAWYLSATLFLYFIFPAVRRQVSGLRPHGLMIAAAAVPVLQLLLGFVLRVVVPIPGMAYLWATYCFPIFRAGDFLLGCILYQLTRSRECSLALLPATLAEAAVMAGGVLLEMRLAPLWNTSVTADIFFNWTTPYLLPAVLLVWLISQGHGLISRFLASPPLVWAGNISGSAFLIHYIVTEYFGRHPETIPACVAAVPLLPLLLKLALSLLLSAAWAAGEKLLRERKA